MSVPARWALPVVAALALLAAAQASAHAELLPPAIAKDGQLLTLTVPNERDDAATTRVAMTVPEGLFVGPFVEAPGWTRVVQRGSGGEIQRVIWVAAGRAGAEGGVFQFVARSESTGSYTVPVAQTYSNGAVVEWAGEQDSDNPAPVVEAKGSVGGDGISALALAALILAAGAVILAGLALLRPGGRES